MMVTEYGAAHSAFGVGLSGSARPRSMSQGFGEKSAVVPQRTQRRFHQGCLQTVWQLKDKAPNAATA